MTVAFIGVNNAFFDERPKGVSWIILDRLQNLHRRRTLRLVGVEHHVNAVGQVVGINRHALDVVCSVHKNADLCIMRLTEAQIVHAAPDFHNAILVNAAVLRIADLQTARIHTLGVDPFRVVAFASIMRNVIDHGMNIPKIIHFPMLGSLRAGHGQRRKFAGVGRLRNAAVVDRIALLLQNIKSLVKLLFRDAQLTLHTNADVDHAFFRDLPFEKFRGGLRLIHARL